jgi:hypothetical protein
MTNFLSKPQIGVIAKLSGKIVNYRCTRASASFVFSENDQRALGVIAVTAAFAGMGGQAASATGHASDMEEAADYLEFDLGGHPVKGWVWRSPFKEGDEVNVAAEWQGKHYEAYGISRPIDKMIALYPHCSRARGNHIRSSVKWWAICNSLFFGIMWTCFIYTEGLALLQDPSFYWVNIPLILFFILMFTSLSNQFMPFVRLAEKIFVALNLPNPTNVDLVASSKQQRTVDDPPEFGTFYFKY